MSRAEGTEARQTTAKRVARRAAVPGGGNAVNITEDVHECDAEQSLAEEEPLKSRGIEDMSKEFVNSGAEVCQAA